jgi:hypothetical protein
MLPDLAMDVRVHLVFTSPHCPTMAAPDPSDHAFILIETSPEHTPDLDR